MKYVFSAKRLGWEKIKDVIWFDSDQYTKEEAENSIKEYQGVTQDGWPYTGYEFDGQKYYDVEYIGEMEDKEMRERFPEEKEE